MTYSYKKLSASKLETIRELQSVKQNIAERMTQAWRYIGLYLDKIARAQSHDRPSRINNNKQ
jgi:hypothetical protein